METDHRFGVCPSRGIYVSLMCPLSPPVSLRPQTPLCLPIVVGAGAWLQPGPWGFALPVFLTQGKKGRGVWRGEQVVGPQGVQSCRAAGCFPGLVHPRGPLLLSGALLLVHTCGLPAKGKFRLSDTWRAGELPPPYFSSLRSGKHHIVAKGPSLSTQVLVARSPAGQGATYLPSGPQPPCLEGRCQGTYL